MHNEEYYEVSDKLVNLLREIDSIDTFNMILLLKNTVLLSEMFIKQCEKVNFDRDFIEKDYKLLDCLRKTSFYLLEFGRYLNKEENNNDNNDQ